MRLTLILTLCFIHVSAIGFTQKITLSEKNTTLKKIIQKISQQSGYDFLADTRLVKSARPVSVDVQQVSIEEALNACLIDQDIEFAIENKIVLLKSKAKPVLQQFNASSKSIDITCKIIDETGLGIPGTTVKVKETGLITITNANGVFTLKNVGENATLIISDVGYVTQEIKALKTLTTITLVAKVGSLNEVAVVAFGVQKKISVVGALSSISNKELLQTPAANVTNTLAGRLPGLISVQTGGDPGRDEATLLVRGKGTYTGNTAPLVLVDGVERSFSTIDANEIANITILKDASATAVYGIRGANGVILVTTRRGTNQKPTISFTTNNSIQMNTRLLQFVNSYQYAILKNEALVNEGAAPFYSQEMLDGYKNHTNPYLYPDVDWGKEFLKKSSFLQQDNINVTGGNNLVKYFVSGSYMSQDGLFNHTKSADFDESVNYSRYNFRSNLDFTLTPSTKLAVNLGVRNDVRRGPYTNQISSYEGTPRIFSEIVRLPPNAMPILNPDGSFSVPSVRVDRNEIANSQDNLLAELTESGEQKEYSNTIDASVILNQQLDKILKGLSFSGNFSMTNAYTQTAVRYKPKIAGGPANNFFARYPLLGQNADGSYIYGGPGTTANQPLISYMESDKLDDKRWYFESKLDYQGHADKHHYTGLVLFNASRQTIPVPTVATDPVSWPKSYLGIASRVTYDYDNRYLAEFNLGYNGSENFAKGKRFGLFPAYALGWVASNEAFLKNSKAIDLLKFRGSYGEVGSDQGISRFAFFDRPYTQAGSYAFGLTNGNSVAGYNEGAFGNPNVQWEVAKKYDLGFESQFFNNLIGINADVFYEKREQILAAYGTIPSILGVPAASLPSANIGRMQNKGYELELSHNNKIGLVDYFVKANVTFARNKILFKDEPKQPYPYLQVTGNSVDQQYGLVTNGFFKNQAEVDAWYAAGYSTNYPDKTLSGKLVPGDFKYIDQNGDKVIDNQDFVPIGHPATPEYTFGINFGATYKSFDFSTQFQGSANASMIVSNEAALAFFNAGSAFKDIYNDRWTPATAETATYPRLSSSPTISDYNNIRNDFWLKDASYIRWKQFQLGYTLAKSLAQKLSIRTARIYVGGADLYTWSKTKYLDPENRQARAWYYPQQRVLSLGINITL